MEQKFECRFCKTKFHKEGTLTTHICVKKRRHMELDTAGSRFGFRTFQRFYELTVNLKKSKTHEEFINSPYYIDFVKFGNHLALLKPLYPDQYTDFIIMGGIKLKDWTRDDIYYLYIDDLIKKEPATSAVERTITNIMTWCEKNSAEFKDFFINLSENEGAYMIQTGKISPWVLYLCSTGGQLVSRFSEEHGKIIGSIIDPGFWMKKFKKNDEEVEYIKTLLAESGL